MLAGSPLAGAPLAGLALVIASSVPLGTPSGLPGIVTAATPIRS